MTVVKLFLKVILVLFVVVNGCVGIVVIGACCVRPFLLMVIAVGVSRIIIVAEVKARGLVVRVFTLR